MTAGFGRREIGGAQRASDTTMTGGRAGGLSAEQAGELDRLLDGDGRRCGVDAEQCSHEMNLLTGYLALLRTLPAAGGDGQLADRVDRTLSRRRHPSHRHGLAPPAHTAEPVAHRPLTTWGSAVIGRYPQYRLPRL